MMYEAKSAPAEFANRRFAPAFDWIWKRLAVWPDEARRVSGIESVVVASTVTWERPIGVVVPKVEGVVVPETPSERSEKAEAAMRWRGEKVTKEELSEETSTWRKRSALVVRFKSKACGKPFAVSPIFTLKTPEVTVTEAEEGDTEGQRREPDPTVALFQMENLK